LGPLIFSKLENTKEKQILKDPDLGHFKVLFESQLIILTTWLFTDLGERLPVKLKKPNILDSLLLVYKNRKLRPFSILSIWQSMNNINIWCSFDSGGVDYHLIHQIQFEIEFWLSWLEWFIFNNNNLVQYRFRRCRCLTNTFIRVPPLGWKIACMDGWGLNLPP